MANNYLILSTQALQILQGGNELVDGVQVGALSAPSGFYFAFRRPKSVATASVIASICTQLAGRYEDVGASPNVTDLQYVADVTDGGQPLDNVRVYWQSDDGSSKGYVVVAQADLGPNKTPPVVAQAVAEAAGVVGDLVANLQSFFGF